MFQSRSKVLLAQSNTVLLPSNIGCQARTGPTLHTPKGRIEQGGMDG
jgi:hypothetical protein